MPFHQLDPNRGIQPPDQREGLGWESIRDEWGGLALVAGLLTAMTVFWGVPVLVVVLAVIAMIFLHEMGHFVAARAAGMKVTEFFLGFGPRLWSFRRGETVYGLKAIPAGAYVRIIGMNNLEEVPPADEHRTYRSKPFWRRLSVAVAGSTMHFLLALVLLFSFLVVRGKVEELPPSDWLVRSVATDTPAEQAGLRAGDRIVAVDGNPIASFEELVTVLPGPGSPVSLGIQRGDDLLSFSLELGTHPHYEDRGYVGIAPRTSRAVGMGYLEAVPETVDTFGFLTKESVLSIGRFFSPSGLGDFYRELTGQPPQATVSPAQSGTLASEASDDQGRIMSIVGAVRVGSIFTDNDYTSLLWFLAVLNIFIGVFNMFPLLPFDGGHVVIATYERLRSWRGRRYTADVGKMVPLAYAVLFVLVFVGLGALYLDITDPIEIPS